MEIMTITGVASFDYFFSIFAYMTLILMVLFGAASLLKG